VSSDETATREALRADPRPAIVPSRFHRSLVHEVEDAIKVKQAGAVGDWLHEHRDRLQLSHDQHSCRWQISHLDDAAPNHAAVVRASVLEHLTAAQEACEVPAFDVQHIETHATLYHHGGFFDWHDDVVDYRGEIAATRRLSFCLYLHSPQRMFDGGELEFMDGRTVEPEHRRLVFFHPVQQHRVRAVECRSSLAIHGRWAVTGWVHGEPPEGWLERLPSLRGRPISG
jgi:Rps23 Pro-64 3,4-dihydroxylase Tpa1-like proline 4-hydroxylase